MDIYCPATPSFFSRPIKSLLNIRRHFKLILWAVSIILYAIKLLHSQGVIYKLRRKLLEIFILYKMQKERLKYLITFTIPREPLSIQ